MAIEVNKAKSRHNSCNYCLSKEGVFEFSENNHHNRVVISACGECLKMLESAIQKAVYARVDLVPILRLETSEIDLRRHLIIAVDTQGNKLTLTLNQDGYCWKYMGTKGARTQIATEDIFTGYEREFESISFFEIKLK